MKYYTLDNTYGFDQAQLDNFNDEFPNWAQENGFDTEDQDVIKNATDAFYNRVMIWGVLDELLLDYDENKMIPQLKMTMKL